jgi:hypothetical protein
MTFYKNIYENLPTLYCHFLYSLEFNNAEKVLLLNLMYCYGIQSQAVLFNVSDTISNIVKGMNEIKQLKIQIYCTSLFIYDLHITE